MLTALFFFVELFRSSMHQDAHEFLNYTLNTIAEDVQKYQQKVADESGSKQGSINSDSQTDSTAGIVHTTLNWIAMSLNLYYV